VKSPVINEGRLFHILMKLYRAYMTKRLLNSVLKIPCIKTILFILLFLDCLHERLDDEILDISRANLYEDCCCGQPSETYAVAKWRKSA